MEVITIIYQFNDDVLCDGKNDGDDDFYDDHDEPILSQIEIERANFGCDFDFNRKQQTRLLEGESECFLKLHKPITFQVGDDGFDDGDGDNDDDDDNDVKM